MRLYCADTSSLIAAWVERYPIENFPPLWEALSDLTRAGRLFAPFEVRVELSKRSDELVHWLDELGGFFVPTDEDLLAEVASILLNHERLVMARKRASAADPFVIGLAKLRDAIVITEEGPGTEAKPKIPFVCQDLKLECRSLIELIRAEGWVIGRSR